jgi:hypothetical protein
VTRRVLVFALALFLAALAVTALVGPVGAQESTTTAANETADDEARDVVEQVDSNVVVTDYSYNATTKTFYVTLENRGDSDVDVTLTEIIDRDAEGARRFGITVVEVEDGETVRASVDAQRVDGAAGVMVLTPEAIETGSGVYLQESQQTDHRLIKGDPQGSHVRSGIAFTGGGTIILVILGAWQYVATANSEEVEPSFDPHITLFGKIWRWRR